MCQQRGKDLDDPWFDELAPLLRIMMFEHWCKDKEETFEMARSQSILIGSFTNPSAAKDMLKSENPDFASSDEDFEHSLQLIDESKKQENQKKRKRQRRKVISSKNPIEQKG